MLNNILQNIENSADEMSASYAGARLRSAFQPIVSLAHHQTVGFEALIRGSLPSGQPLLPQELFSRARTEFDTVYLDRLCRALHISTFQRAQNNSDWLFLNVNPGVIVHGVKYGTFFRELLAKIRLSAEQVVVEILENTLLDESQLDNCVAFYRDLGCLIAIDDFGAGSSSFQRIWRLKPHIVKLDRSIIFNAASNATARRMLPSIVETLHEAGGLVLVEGVETECEAMIAMETSADLVQGYYFGRPAAELAPANSVAPFVSDLFSQYRRVLDDNLADIGFPVHAAALELAAGCLDGNLEVRPDHLECLHQLLLLPGAECCYLLDQDGKQVGETHRNLRPAHHENRHFKPLRSGPGTIWIRRPYWRRAMLKPNEVQCTRPYLSIVTSRLCITLSVAYQSPAGLRVLCFDLDCETLKCN
jgi:EAL domain-containing protein (putative c-di-GMP-specific phosphodiesterase class I)